MDPEPTFIFQLLGLCVWVLAFVLVVLVKPPQVERAIGLGALGLALFFFPTLWNSGETAF